MKKLFILIFLCLSITSIKAQNKYVSGMLFFQTEFESEQLKLTIAPEFGVLLKDNAAIGATLKAMYEKDKHTVLSIEPYYRKYILQLVFTD